MTPLVHVRTPTYRRSEMLTRALRSLQQQTWTNWICDIYDDDPDASGRLVCEALGDNRIRYNHNRPQRFASKNIDMCFARANPHDADYFCVLEDDNQLLPGFIAENIAAATSNGVEIVFRNQFIEFDSGTPDAKVGDAGILDEMYREAVYAPEEFRLSLLPGIGISNGGVFWSRQVRSNLEIGCECTATLQEYMRTFAIAEPIYLAMEPLAIWALNGSQTTRDFGSSASYLQRELNLKRSIQILQRQAWMLAREEDRTQFLNSTRFAYEPSLRAKALIKSLIGLRVGPLLSTREKINLLARGMVIRLAGRATSDLQAFARQFD